MKSYKLFSGIVNDNFMIDISLPENYNENENERYPVLYMTDGNWRRGQHKPIHEMTNTENVEEMIVVGISYPDDYNPDSIRVRDLITSADKFLGFILHELIPYIDKNYRTITTDRTLWGSSFGGYFAMYVLFHACDTTKDVFKNYIVASPAAFRTTKFNDKDMNLFDYERIMFEKTNELKENLYITVGGVETQYFKDSFNNLVRVLKERNYKDFYFKSYIDPGKDHYTVWEPALYTGIKLFLKK